MNININQLKIKDNSERNIEDLENILNNIFNIHENDLDEIVYQLNSYLHHIHKIKSRKVFNKTEVDNKDYDNLTDDQLLFRF